MLVIKAVSRIFCGEESCTSEGKSNWCNDGKVQNLFRNLLQWKQLQTRLRLPIKLRLVWFCLTPRSQNYKVLELYYNSIYIQFALVRNIATSLAAGLYSDGQKQQTNIRYLFMHLHIETIGHLIILKIEKQIWIKIGLPKTWNKTPGLLR